MKENIQYFFLVVDGAITHQSPRAWVFDSEEAAVKFRCEKVEMHSRRHGSLSPVYQCELNPQDKNASLVEIAWNKYQFPKEQKEKKFQ